ncbi:Alpha/Beta hydrolase protein [Entophlyctis helioformis]|nr:Alpha/Beta hydrolase protein [Entophlyctis helioformis]
MTLKIVALLAAAAAAAATAAGAKPQTDGRPMRAEDLVSMHRLTTPVPSPSGRVAVFSASQYSVATDSTVSTLYLSHLNSPNPLPPFALGTGLGSDPFWLADNLLAIRCPRNGVSQICYANLANIHNGSAVEFVQLTTLTAGISSAKFRPLPASSGVLAFTSTVAIKPKPKFASGVVYDKLFVRHWDKYLDPASRSHLFVTRLAVDTEAGTVAVDGDLLDLFVDTPDLETPIAPFGDATSYDISPDGNVIAFASRVPEHKAAWNTNIDIYLVRTDATYPPIPISQNNLGADALPLFSPDGKSVAWLQMKTPGYESDINKVAVYDLTKKKTTILGKKWDRSPESLVYISDTVLATTVQDNARMKVYTVDTATGKIAARTHEAATHAISLVPGTNSLIGLVHSMKFPDEVALIDTKEWKTTFITSLNEDAISELNLSDPEELWFKGANNEKVHSWVLKPPGFDKKKKYPLAFLIHGGPEGAWNDDWSYRWNPQVFAAQGFFVATVNFHGSTGFGPEFERAILGNWGGAPYQDLMKGLSAVLDAYPQIDRRRVAGLGASYGGYMINWINGHSRRFACLVNHDGMFDTVSAYFATEELWFPESEFTGTPFDRKAAKVYQKYSPRAFAHKWESPTLVIHGELDYRLSVTEGLSTFTALQRRNIPSKLLYFPDENHWVLKPANSLLWHSEIVDWISHWTSEKVVDVTGGGKDEPVPSDGFELDVDIDLGSGNIDFDIVLDGSDMVPGDDQPIFQVQG